MTLVIFITFFVSILSRQLSPCFNHESIPAYEKNHIVGSPDYPFYILKTSTLAKHGSKSIPKKFFSFPRQQDYALNGDRENNMDVVIVLTSVGTGQGAFVILCVHGTRLTSFMQNYMKDKSIDFKQQHS
jgi:hypothetical protein